MSNRLHDPARLAALQAAQILGTPPEVAYDGLARLATVITGAPVALVNFIDGDRQYFKAHHGVDLDTAPNTVGYCPRLIQEGNEIVSPSTLKDPRFRDNAVNEEPYSIRAYAGVPVRDHAGYILGSICVLDVKEREFDHVQLQGMRDLAHQIEQLLELRRQSLQQIAATERLQQISEMWPGGFAVLDPLRNDAGDIEDFRFDWINANGAAQTGGTVESLMGCKLDEAPAGPVKEPLRSLYHRVAEGGGEETVEIVFPEGHASRYRARQVGRTVAVAFDDVSDERAARVALITTEERLRLASDTAGIGIWEIDLGAGLSTRTLLHDRIFGYEEPVADWNAETFFSHILPEHVHEARRGYEELTAGGETWNIKYPIRRVDGSLRWVEGVGRRVPSGSDRVVGTLQDVTEVYEATRALALRELEQREIFDTMPQIVWRATPDGIPDYFNRRWHEITGHRPDESYNYIWQSIVHSGDLDRLIAHWGHCVATGDDFECEVRCLDAPSGEYRWYLTRGVAIRGDDGTITRWFGSMTDIDDKKRFEEVLEMRVAERTEALAQANSELEGFTHTVSHDLRAPLRAIIASARFIEEDYEGAIPPAALALVRRQAESARRLGELMDDLLQLTRLGRQKIERERVDLSAVARDEGGPDILVDTGLAADGDPRLLRLLLRNLLDNAQKFSPDGGPIHVGKDENGAFFVRDEGIGFEPRYGHKLFLPFERLVKEDEYPGSGIGLANVKRIVDRHGGKVWAEGRPGEGATFYFTLGS